MQDDNNLQPNSSPTEDSQTTPVQPPQVISPPSADSGNSGVQPSSQVVSQQVAQPFTSPAQEHKLLKVYLVVSLVVLLLNTGLLALTLIPFAGVFIALGAAPIFLATGSLGLINLFVTYRALSKKYFTGGFRKVVITVLVLSVMAVLGGASSPFVLAVQHKENAKTQKTQDAVNSVYSEVTVQKATELLNSCQIYQLSYNNGKGNDWEKNPETNKSGILIYNAPTKYGAPSPTGSGYVGGKYIMYLADRTVNTIVPVARQAQKTCGIQFYHNDTDEQWKGGHWYFNGSLVN